MPYREYYQINAVPKLLFIDGTRKLYNKINVNVYKQIRLHE